jgi:hypothetical protein
MFSNRFSNRSKTWTKSCSLVPRPRRCIRTPLLLLAVTLVSFFSLFSRIAIQETHTSHAGVPTGHDKIKRIYVMTLSDVPLAHAENTGRFDSFISDWRNVCGDSLVFHRCSGEFDKRQGFGLTRAYVSCFDDAILQGGNISYFFEDDSRLFNSDFCNPVFREKIWKEASPETFLLLLGGHTFQMKEEFRLKGSGYMESTRSFGSYGFSLTLTNLKLLRKYFAADYSQVLKA